jgi:mannose-1-phosphate guanylyltransferase
MNNYAIILAGGIGSRFWPLSRTNEPKQFLNICSKRPMLEETVRRIDSLVKKDNIYIATNKIYHKKIKNYLKKLNIYPRNILFEPEARNTLAPLGLLSKNIYDKDKEAVILVFPSDHYIKDKNRFSKILAKAIYLAKRGYIVTLGVAPRRPETAYGYIKVKSKLKILKSKAYVVDSFIEKPSITKAKKLIKDKRFYWNAGIFIFRADTMLQELKKFAPDDYNVIKKIKDVESLDRLWPQITSISIDYAVMEKTGKMVLVPTDFGWIDLGSWQAIEEFSKKDENGNVFKCRYKNIDLGSRNTLVWSDCRFVATLGLNNVIIVDTKDALLVCSKDKAQEIKSIVQKLAVKRYLRK